jgi:hypothetical protein
VQRNDTLVCFALGQFGSVHHIASQLATSGVDIVTAGFANRGHQSRLLELLREPPNSLNRRSQQA